MTGREVRRAAVLGSPITHSLSPVLHRAAYSQLGLHWQYEAIEVAEGGLAAFVDTLDETWAGLSLTMPLKKEARELATEAGDSAMYTRVANTLVREGAQWSAYNTDVTGMISALAEAGVAPESVGILGAGATATSAVLAVATVGARTVRLAARRPNIPALTRMVATYSQVSVSSDGWQAAAQMLDAGLVVSTVPAAVAAELIDAIPSRPGVLFDVLYDPWPTPFAAAWAERGGRVLGGLDLLVHQAVDQVELMTGGRPRVDTLRAAGLAALRSR